MKPTRFSFLASTLLLLGGVVLVLLSASQTAQAFPEYAAQTGETCGTCHFNPAGGGPRTPRGELWVIEDHPDIVPELLVEEAAAEVEPAPVDVPQGDLLGGAQLYELFTCDNCHGILGEGTNDAPALNQEVLSATRIETTIRTGPEAMPAIPETIMNADQMEMLVAYIQNLATGRVVRVETLNAAGPILTVSTEAGQQ